MKFNNLAEQIKTLFAGTVLIEGDQVAANYYEESATNAGLEVWGEPFQIYAVELRTDYATNAKEYDAAGVYYSELLGCYLWPVLSCGISWNTKEPQNIFTDWED